MVNLAELKQHPSNPRSISASALGRLKDSIQRDPEYMIARPIIVGSDNIILGGNQRWRACTELGMTLVPDEWVRRVEWDAEKARRFVLVDNGPSGMAGDWDLDVLTGEWKLPELEALGFDLDVLESINSDFSPDLPTDDGIIVTYECPKCGYKWKKANSQK